MQEIKNLVLDQLAKDPETRDDDRILYVRLCHTINPLVSNMPFTDVFVNPQMFGLPNYDSVSRARRKAQEEYPELRGTERKTNKRYEKWKEMREFALS